jgi:hypothetical protein
MSFQKRAHQLRIITEKDREHPMWLNARDNSTFRFYQRTQRPKLREGVRVHVLARDPPSVRDDQTGVRAHLFPGCQRPPDPLHRAHRV